MSVCLSVLVYSQNFTLHFPRSIHKTAFLNAHNTADFLPRESSLGCSQWAKCKWSLVIHNHVFDSRRSTFRDVLNPPVHVL